MRARSASRPGPTPQGAPHITRAIKVPVAGPTAVHTRPMEAMARRRTAAPAAGLTIRRVPAVGVPELARVAPRPRTTAAPSAAPLIGVEASVAAEDAGRGVAPLAAAPHPLPAGRTATAEGGAAAAAARARTATADPVEAARGWVDLNGRTCEAARPTPPPPNHSPCTLCKPVYNAEI